LTDKIDTSVYKDNNDVKDGGNQSVLKSDTEKALESLGINQTIA
jgi:hypothetical protein